MRFLTYNPNGLGGGPRARYKGSWILSYIQRGSDIGAVALQETHCSDIEQLCQPMQDMRLSHHVLHSGHAEGDTYAGVCLVISREFEVVNERVLSAGRLMVVRVRSVVFLCEMDLVVVYGYPGAAGTPGLIRSLEVAVDDSVPVVMMGDWNFVVDGLDRCGGAVSTWEAACGRHMASVLEGTGLCDAFRVDGNTDIVFSYEQGLHRSRIDRMYLDGVTAGRVKGCRYFWADGVSSGHKVFEVEIEDQVRQGVGYWKFNVSLLRDRSYTELLRGKIREVREGKADFGNDGEWWDWAKEVWRLVTVDYSREKAGARREYVRRLEEERKRLEWDVVYGWAGDRERSELERVVGLLKEEEERKAEGHRVRARLPNFAEREPGVAYISKMEKSRSGRNLIYALRDRQGMVQYGSEGVLDVAYRFYTDLFTSEGTDPDVQDQLLDRLTKTLSRESREMCEGEMTVEELGEALRTLQNGKAPGEDGFPAEFWKFFWADLSSDFKGVAECAYESGRLPASMRGGVIRLLYKKGDKLEVGNYRPVTLVGADYKIISRVIARRMSKVMPELIHEDQTCVPGRRITTNLHILRDVVDYCDNTETPAAILCLDQEKCFDRVDHGFMLKVMGGMGYGPGFLRWIRVFYNGVHSRVLINGFFSDEIRLDRGTRQGDPPSSHIYVMVAEVLASQIRGNPRIKGVRVSGVEKKIGQYADDTQAFLTSDESMRQFMSEVRLYEAASGGRLNVVKTEGLWIGPWRARTDRPFGFAWRNNRVRVLGVWIGETTCAGDNFTAQFASIHAKLKAWKSRPLSELGKVMVANVLLYSRLWYRTEIWSPPCNMLGGGCGNVEKAVAEWVFRGRQEVCRDRLKAAYEYGGAQLVDVKDKVKAQRVAWLCRLLAMPRGSFPRVLAAEMIGDQRWGWRGLEVLGAEARVMEKVGSAFYREALKAWRELGPKVVTERGTRASSRLFHNVQIVGADGHPLRSVPWLVLRDVTSVRSLWTLSGLGLGGRGKWDEVARLRGIAPEMPLSEPHYLFDISEEGKDHTRVSFRELYVAFRRRARSGSRHYEEKWERALGASLDGHWPDIWRRLHSTPCSLRVRSDVWKQVGLNFWTPHMATWVGDGNGECRLCGEVARERWHVVIECEVVRRLWRRLEPTLIRVVDMQVVEGEMAFGPLGERAADRLRRRLGFGLRSAVHTMRGLELGSVEVAVERVWSLFVGRLRKQLQQEWILAVWQGKVGSFAASVLVGGVLGKMVEGGVVEWCGILDGVGYREWDLFG